MKWKIVFLSTALCLTGLVLAKEAFRPEPDKPAPDFMAGTQVWIEGNSSLRRYTLTAEKISAKSNLNTSDSRLKTLLALILNRKGHRLVVTVPAKSLKSGVPFMDGIAYEKLKAKDCPDIVFTLKEYRVKAYPGSLTTYALAVSGKLSLAGVEKDVVMESTMVLGSDGIKIYGSQDIYQKDYGITPYSMALLLTTDNKIVVHYAVSLGLRQKEKT